MHEYLYNKKCNGRIKLEKKIDELKEEKENQEKIEVNCGKR